MSSENTDFNDLHVSDGLCAVRDQLYAALNLPIIQSSLSPPDEPATQSIDEPLAPIDDWKALDGLIRRFALLMPDGKIWDSFKRQVIKKTAFKDMVTPNLFFDWLHHKNRRTVDKSVLAALPPKDGERGLSMALGRYIYVNPADFAWDTVTQATVPLSHLKFAIADCWDDWIKHPNRKDVSRENFVFDPSQKVDPQTHINTFKGFACEPVNNDLRCTGILNSIFALCNGDAEVYRWLLCWLAYPIQNPGAKMDTAVLVHSTIHGSGKSLMFDLVMRGIYGEYAKTVGQAQLEGNYNDWMSRTLYACYEEVLSRGQKYAHTGTIKQTITGVKVRIEKKFMSGWEESNHMNCVFLSNEIVPIPVEPSDRRFLVIWPEKTMGEDMQRQIDFELNNGGPAALMGFLLSFTLEFEGKPFNQHTKPPMTEAKRRLIDHGKPSWEVFFESWQDGSLFHDAVNVPFTPCRVSDLFYIFDKWCNKNKESGMGAHKFASFISTQKTVKKYKDMHYQIGNDIKKATFFIQDACKKPSGELSQREWLGTCVAEFGRIVGDINANQKP